jgi:hypothetical protein
VSTPACSRFIAAVWRSTCGVTVLGASEDVSSAARAEAWDGWSALAWDEEQAPVLAPARFPQ